VKQKPKLGGERIDRIQSFQGCMLRLIEMAAIKIDQTLIANSYAVAA
jgi:hypothetical protein